ncbi:MAG: DNA cytosine methyltransferase [Polyangiaceae bacterium]|nr:DNA cytosine methyltransferase [Polyangiaceae bacterium]
MPKAKTDDTSTAFTAVDLFCGAGGFSLGLERAGFDVRLAVDSWQLAVDSYEKNFKHPVLCRDLASMTGRELLRAAGLRRRAPSLHDVFHYRNFDVSSLRMAAELAGLEVPEWKRGLHRALPDLEDSEAQSLS